MGKSTISMTSENSYVKWPEGTLAASFCSLLFLSLFLSPNGSWWNWDRRWQLKWPAGSIADGYRCWEKTPSMGRSSPEMDEGGILFQIPCGFHGKSMNISGVSFRDPEHRPHHSAISPRAFHPSLIPSCEMPLNKVNRIGSMIYEHLGPWISYPRVHPCCASEFLGESVGAILEVSKVYLGSPIENTSGERTKRPMKKPYDSYQKNAIW